MSKYLVSNNNDILGIFNDFNESFSYFLDFMIHDLKIILDTQNLNEKIKIPEYVYKICEFKSSIMREDLIEYNIIHNEIEVIESYNIFLQKVNKIKSYQNDLLKSKLYNEILEEFSNEEDVNKKIYGTNELKFRDLNNIIIESESDSDSNAIGVISSSSESEEYNEQLELQLKKIQELERKKQEIENSNKKKKEKEDEINRRFEVDYDLYFKLSNEFEKNVPDLFKNQYPVFNEMKIKDILNNKELSKQYYKKIMVE